MVPHYTNSIFPTARSKSERVHVECEIRRFKVYKMLTLNLPNSLTPKQKKTWEYVQLFAPSPDLWCREMNQTFFCSSTLCLLHIDEYRWLFKNLISCKCRKHFKASLILWRHPKGGNLDFLYFFVASSQSVSYVLFA